MLERVGDLWTYQPCDVVVIPTNGVLIPDRTPPRAVMGKGVALQAKIKVPRIDRMLGNWIMLNGNVPGMLYMLRNQAGESRMLVSFPTKDNYEDDSKLDLIEQSAWRLLEMANSNYEWKAIVLPHVGCGAGGLQWSQVRPILDAIFDDRFVAVDKPRG